MASFRIVPELETLLRALTPEEYNQLKINVELNGLDEKSLTVANVLGDRILLDGHTRFKICTALRIPIDNGHLKIKKLPNLDSCKQWIIDNALGQRNLSADGMKLLRESRHQKIVEMRQEGHSERAIADEVKVSPATVHRELERATASGEAVEPESGEIHRKDGKTQSAPKPIFCERCTRSGPVKDCPKCVAARRTKKASGRKKKDKAPRLDGRMTKSGAPAFEIKMLSQHISRAKAEVDKLKKWPGQGKDPRHAACLRLLEEAFKTAKEWHKEALKVKT